MKLSFYQQMILLFVCLKKNELTKKSIWRGFKQTNFKNDFKKPFYRYEAINRNILRLIRRKILMERDGLVQASPEGYMLAKKLAQDWSESIELNSELSRLLEEKYNELYRAK